MKSHIFLSESESDTNRLGAALADALLPGMVVALDGPLGAGKTRLVQAVAVALGVPREAVTSPTFVMVNEYTQGRLPVYHFDAYRVRDLDEFSELGADEYFFSSGVCLVEWGERVAAALPADRLDIEIEVTGESGRQFAIAATGAVAEAQLAVLVALVSDK